MRDLAREAAGHELRALTTLFADHTDRTLQGVDLLLSLLAGRLETVLATANGRDPQLLNDTLRAGLAGIPQLRGALVLDRDGTSIGDAHAVPPRVFHAADRPEFQIHRDQDGAGLFISDPIESPISNRLWSIPLSRRLNARDGSFAGVVVGIVNPEYFASVYATTGGTGNSHTTLLKKDGIVLATTSTASLPGLGQRVAIDPGFVSKPQGMLSGVSPVTGQARLAAYADAHAYPVTVITSRDESAIADPSTRSERIIIAAGLLVSALTIALGWVVSRQMRSLAERFRDGIERMPAGFLLWDREERLIAWNARYEQLIPEAGAVLRRGISMEQMMRETLSRCRPDMTRVDADAFVAARCARFRDPGSSWELRLEDGRVIEIEESRTEAGGIVTIGRDMTARKHHEAALEHALAAERDAVLRMTALIDRTLSSARLEEGRIVVERQRIDLLGVLTEICDRQRQISGSFEIALRSSEQAVMIDADPRLLEQVFSNLLSNAVKYSGCARRVDVVVATQEEPAPAVVVTVRDHGVGIPADEVDKLFGRFFRARTAAGISGTGLGLHVTRELVLLHGGVIDVTSQLDQGSSFTVRLPREPRVPGMAAAAS